MRPLLPIASVAFVLLLVATTVADDDVALKTGSVFRRELGKPISIDRDDAELRPLLHTARGTLGDLLGVEGQRPVLEVIRATHERWGDARYDAARAALAAQG